MTGSCRDCKHWGLEPHYQFLDLRQCTLINTKAIPSVIELRTVLLESGDYASSDALLWVDGSHGCALFESEMQSKDTAPSKSPEAPERFAFALSELLSPDPSPLKLAILGVKRQPGAPEPLHITTLEEYRAAYPGSSPPRELFEPEPMLFVAVEEVPGPGADQVPPPLYVGDGYGRIRREP